MRSTTINSETDTANSPARTRRSRTLLLAGATLVALTASACNLPVEQWVPDFDGDGVISQAEIDRQSGVIIAAVTESVEQQRREVQQHSFLTCVRRHESDRTGAWPHIGGYTTESVSRATLAAVENLLNFFKGN